MTRISSMLTGCVLVLATVNQSADAGPLKALWKGARGLVGKAMGESTDYGAKAVARTLARQTDDAARLAARGTDEAAELAGRVGNEAVGLADGVAPPNSTRLLRMADELKAGGTVDEVGGLLKSGNRADVVMNFVARHKGTLATGAAVSVLVTNPDAVLGAAAGMTVGLADAAGRHVVEPVIETAGGPIIRTVLMLATTGLLILVMTALVVAYAWWKRRQTAPVIALQAYVAAWLQRRRQARRAPMTETAGSVSESGDPSG